MSTSSPDTVTQTTAPPAFLEPFLRRAASQSETAFRGGGPEQFPGSRVVPLAGETEQALQLQGQRALQGSPVTGAAQDLATQTLQGDFLGQGNPFVNQQIQRAIQLSRTGLESQFAGAGRDLEAQLPARAEQVQNITNDFLFRNFDAERNRQLQTQALAPTLAAQDFLDIGALRDVGGVREAQSAAELQDQVSRFGFEQQRPELALDQLIARLQGNPLSGFGSSSQPVFQNRGAGALGGALAGAQLGSVVPGLGTGIGAGLGALSGLLF